MRPLDTSPEVWDRVVRHWQTTSGPEKVESARRLGRSTLDLIRSGIRARHPEYGDAEIHLAVMRRILGSDLYRCVFPNRPDIEL